MTTSKSMVLHL